MRANIASSIPLNVLFIDNFDSFSFNIVDDLKRCNANVTVVRNDVDFGVLQAFIVSESITHIVISPGPGSPKDAGICIDTVKKFRGKLPILGICLGFQVIVEVCGGEIGVIEKPYHGKSSKIFYRDSQLLLGLSNPFTAGRYHSLAATKVTNNLTITAEVDDMPMAIESELLGLFGVQFHPESILTPAGHLIFENFFKQQTSVNGQF